MAPIMYKTLTLGIAGDEYHTYYYEYDNKTGQFAFKVHTDIRGGKREGIELIQTYIFNITSYNDIYKSLFNHNYSTSVTQIADVLVTSVDDYRGIFTKEKAIPSMLNINCENQTKALNVVFSKPILVESTFCWNLKELGYNVININGNGSTIHAETKPREEFKWAITAEGDYTLTASNIKVEGFNTAIVNNGICILNNVTLHNNKMDYICERDDGAAMLNSGFVIANDCTFTDNYAKNGGAIFSQGQLILNNCTYNDNTGYGTGNDILNVDKGSVFINGKEIKGSQGTVTYVESISDTATALISAVAGVGTVLLGVASGAIAFVLSGGNVVVAVAVGVAAGAAIGGIVGTAAARAITSGQYNLAYDRVSTAIQLIRGCVVLGIEAGMIGASVIGPSQCKINNIEYNYVDENDYQIKDIKSNKNQGGWENRYEKLVQNEKLKIQEAIEYRINGMKDYSGGKNIVKITAVGSERIIVYKFQYVLQVTMDKGGVFLYFPAENHAFPVGFSGNLCIG